MNDEHTKQNDVDDVAKRNQQLIQSRTIRAQFTVEVYNPFTNYLGLKYTTYEEAEHNKQKELDYVFSLGIEKAKKELECSVLFEEKKPRRDVLENLGEIAKEFLSNPEYPLIKSMAITKTINKIMGFRDGRTKARYHKCVQQYIGKPKELGLADVSEFVDRIPSEYLNTTSTSSIAVDSFTPNNAQIETQKGV